MSNSLTYRYFYAGIIFNILFSVFGFAFTAFPSTGTTTFNLPIDEDSLYKEGIVFVNATFFNLTYNGNWTYFESADRNMRIAFKESTLFSDPLVDDGIIIQQQGLVQQYLDSWLFPTTLSMDVGKSYDPLIKNLPNGTIVNYFESEFNWTRFRTLNSVTGFVTTIESDDNNITKAVYETGILTITLGEVEVTIDTDITTFLRWYWNTLFSFGYDGFPSYLGWILKLIVIVNFVSGILVAREQLKV